MISIKKNIDKTVLFFLLIIVFTSTKTQAQIDSIFTDFPVLKGKYFMNKVTGDKPEVFAPFLFNFKTHHIHCAPVFNPEMDEMFISVYVNNEMPQRIFHLRKVNGVWQKPELAPFSGKYQDGGPTLSPDGKTIYFYSRRPENKNEAELEQAQIWFAKKVDNKWGKAALLKLPKEIGLAFYPNHFSSNGVFYFMSKVANRDYDMFQSVIEDNIIKDIKRLSEPFNMKGLIEGGAVTDPTNTFLVFHAYNRYGNGEDLLHISKKQKDGSWSTPKKMSKNFNQSHGRFGGFTPNGKFFFFSSYRNGDEQIFWVSSKVLMDEFKSE